jgi:predicted O-linked N-acetylglucosamine transferase (SPINDLY family)
MSNSESNFAEIHAKLSVGLAHHQAGELDKAASLYESILATEPTYSEAIHLLGLVYHQRGQHRAAERIIRHAIGLNQSEPLYLKNHAVVLQVLGEFENSIVSCANAIQLNPNYGDAHYQKGISENHLGRHEDAAISFKEAIKLRPKQSDYYNHLGVTLTKLKRFESAILAFKQAVDLNPQSADAQNNLGICLKRAGQLEAALLCHQNAIKADPLRADSYSHLGAAHIALERYNQAIVFYDKAIQIAPSYSEAYNNRGNALQALGEIKDAILSYRKAIHYKHDYGDAYNNLGAALLKQAKPDEALINFKIAIELNSDSADSYSNQANALLELGQFELAIQSYRAALNIDPLHSDAHCNLGNALIQMGRLDEALVNYSAAITLNPASEYVLGTIQHINMRHCNWSGLESSQKVLQHKIMSGEPVARPWVTVGLFDSAQLQKTASICYAKKYDSNTKSRRGFDNVCMSTKIKIGYYSADFHDHATAHLIAEFLERHNKARFEVFGFSFGPNSHDSMRMRIVNSLTQFFDVSDQSDEDIATFSRDIGIDIAIDLKGYTQGHRTRIFSYGCAPVQVNFLGYPGTMGSKYIDYIIADKIVIPNHLMVHYSEKIVRLPGSYQPNDSKRLTPSLSLNKADLNLPNDVFVFCCFNNNYKILPSIFDLWMKILGEVDDSILWLLKDNETVESNLSREAELRGINRSRLVFADRVPLETHFSRHQLADLFLDTWPCNAHTTASDALWCGLPLITLVGETFASRVAASLLTSLGLSDLVATSKDEYHSLAVDLAKNPVRLDTIKQKLALAVARNSLFDGQIFARKLELAYETIYSRFRSGLKPDHFDVLDLN